MPSIYKVYRNDILSAIQQEHAAKLVGSRIFKKKFKKYWGSNGEKFSLINDSQSKAMRDFLKIDDPCAENDCDLVLEDVWLKFDRVKFNDLSQVELDTVLARIKENVLDVYGYSLKYTKEGLVSPVFDRHTQKEALTIYRYIYRILQKYADQSDDSKPPKYATFIFTWEDVKEDLRDLLLNESEEFADAFISFEDEHVTPYDALFSLNEDGTHTINMASLWALSPLEFIEFLSQGLDTSFDVYWWVTVFKVVLIAITIVALVYSLGVLGLFAFGGAGAALAAGGSTTSVILSGLSLGVSAASSVYSFSELGIDGEVEAPQTPSSTQKNIYLSDELYWEGIASQFPQAQIEAVFDKNI